MLVELAISKSNKRHVEAEINFEQLCDALSGSFPCFSKTRFTDMAESTFSWLFTPKHFAFDAFKWSLSDTASKIDDGIHTRWMLKITHSNAFVVPCRPELRPASSTQFVLVLLNQIFLSSNFFDVSLLTEMLFAVLLCFVCLSSTSMSFFVAVGLYCFTVYGFGAFSVLWIQINFVVSPAFFPSRLFETLETIFIFYSMLIYCFICFDRQSHSSVTFLRKVKLFTFSSCLQLRIPFAVSVEKGSNEDVNRERFRV